MKDLLKDPLILRQIIMEHYQHPLNHKASSSPDYISVATKSDSCIDDFTVEILLEKDQIKDLKFTGTGCAISTASISIMTKLLQGKSVAEAEKIIAEYFKMVAGEEYDFDLLEEANAFSNINKQANRIKCATIGWKGAKKILDEQK